MMTARSHTRASRTLRRTVAAVAALALLAGACGTDDDPDTDDPTAEDGDDTADDTGADPLDDAEDAEDDAADDTSDGEAAGDATEDDDAGDDPVTVTLLTHDSFDVSEDVLDGFTADTGIEVEILPLGDAGEALNQTILTADAPQGDLLFGVDTSFLSRALDEDLFVPYESDLLAQVPERFQLDDEHRVTPIDVGDVCLNYDVAAFDGERVPEDLADLTDPAYEGTLTVMNPATSSPGLSFLLATVERFGEDGYLDFWEALVDNDVLVTDGWSEAYYEEFSGTGGGDRPLVVSYASSPPAEVFFAEEELDEAPTGVIEASCFRQIEFVGILDGTPHEAEAQQVVDLMLGVEFQEDVPLTMFVYPVNENAALPEVFEEHATLPADPLELDPMVIGENREAWIEAWTDTVLR